MDNFPKDGKYSNNNERAGDPLIISILSIETSKNLIKMAKYLTPNGASSPVSFESSPVATKNDSFLEDVGVIPYGRKDAECNVTRRTKSPLLGQISSETTINEEFEGDHSGATKRCRLPTDHNAGESVTIRSSRRLEVGSGDRLQLSDSRVAATAKEAGKGKSKEGRPSSQEIKAKSRHSDSKGSDSRTKLQNEKSKAPQQERKSSGKRSPGSREKEKSLETSDDSKHSSGRSKQSNSLSELSKEKEVPSSVALLNAIKEIVSTYTKEEGIKISKTVNELHILNQASIIKNFIFLTDELRKTREYPGDYRTLVEENRILQDNFEFLKRKYESMKIENEEINRIKEENIALKLKLQELSARELK